MVFIWILCSIICTKVNFRGIFIFVLHAVDTFCNFWHCTTSSFLWLIMIFLYLIKSDLFRLMFYLNRTRFLISCAFEQAARKKEHFFEVGPSLSLCFICYCLRTMYRLQKLNLMQLVFKVRFYVVLSHHCPRLGGGLSTHKHV